MRPQPYIGITGFTSEAQIRSVLNNAGRPKTNRPLMAGVLASRKSLEGVKSEKYPGRYPRIEDIGKIFFAHPGVLNLVHWSTTSQDGMVDQIETVMRHAGPHCDGIQLNMTWPDPVAIRKARRGSDIRVVVLQIGMRALDEINWNPRILPEKLKPYLECIEYVLIDPSGGTGKALDYQFARECIYQLREHRNLGVGVAGGLTAANLQKLELIKADFPDTSIDAEGRLRDDRDRLRIDAAAEYLQAAHKFFASRTLIAS